MRMVKNLLRRWGNHIDYNLSALAVAHGITALPPQVAPTITEKIKEADNPFVFKDIPLVQWHPRNDGLPNLPIVWYNKEQDSYRRIIDNTRNFAQIDNVAEMLSSMTDIMREGYRSNIPLAPYDNFAIRLTGTVDEGYSGPGSLVVIGHARPMPKHESARRRFNNYTMNLFLDRFIGGNYGDVVRKDGELEKKLHEFNGELVCDRVRTPTGGGARIDYDGVDRSYQFPIP